MQALDEKFMGEALALAEGALSAGEFPVGCVLVSENRVVARGARIGSAGAGVNEIDHAEIVALRRLYGLPGGRKPGCLTVYSTLEPCLMCFGALVIAGVGRIVYAYEDTMGGGCGCQLTHLPVLYRKSPLEIVPHVMRERSLSLFQSFFRAGGSDYLRGTLLADYTLRQSPRASEAEDSDRIY